MYTASIDVRGGTYTFTLEREGQQVTFEIKAKTMEASGFALKGLLMDYDAVLQQKIDQFKATIPKEVPDVADQKTLALPIPAEKLPEGVVPRQVGQEG